MLRAVVLLSFVYNTAFAQATPPSEDDLDPIIVTASGDPVLTAIRVDAEDHRRKVVAQSCLFINEDKDGRSQTTRRYAVEGPSAFGWALEDMLVDGKTATEKQRRKIQKEMAERNKDRKADDDDRYAIFADLIAERDQVEKLPAQDGMLRYRINRLPKKMADDLPGAIAKHLKPVIWVADAEGSPYVRRLEVTMGDFRMYLIAKINTMKMDVQFERRADGYVKEREIRVEGDYSVFGRKRFNRMAITCELGGPIVVRPETDTKK
jgi:hypothetical protein